MTNDSRSGTGNALQKAPESIPDNAVMPAPIPFGSTPRKWNTFRQDILEHWLECLGPFPSKCALDTVILEEDTPLHGIEAISEPL